jgi:hypothetical protein
VRPSSLNYKISLLEAVTAFMQKDKTAEQVLDIELEEPINKNRLNFDVLDDALYAVNKASVVVAQQNITKAIAVTKTVKNPA